jgi:hypothetical protein
VQLAANVDFTFETGRKSVRVLLSAVSVSLFSDATQVLEMLHSCAKEFADDVLQVAITSKLLLQACNSIGPQAYSDTLLLALVTRLVNETSRSVKAMVVQVRV